jgi:hypothetical protein
MRIPAIGKELICFLENAFGFVISLHPERVTIDVTPEVGTAVVEYWIIATMLAPAFLAAAVLRFVPDLVNRYRHRQVVRAMDTPPEAGIADPRQGIVLMPVCGRPHYLRQVLEALARCEAIEKHWVVFSQDGDDAEVSAAIETWRLDHPASMHMRHARPYFALPSILGVFGFRPEYLISANIYSLLRFGFDRLRADWVIVLEDDLVPARDFLPFFAAAHRQLLADRNRAYRVLAVCGWSNWNFSRSVSDAQKDPRLLYKVKLTRFTCWAWSIDASRWPLVRSAWRTYFSAWDGGVQRLRERAGLLCATPVVSRVLNIGMQGVNFRENEADPGVRWRTQSILTDATQGRFDPARRLEAEFLPPSAVTFIDGTPAD